jgi:5-methyltetrahydrofolate--homocysteine methyltransferase
MDGAMGTELRRAGLADDGCGERWNLAHPDRVRAIHQAYADAGAECLLTNSFQANPVALARHGLEARLEAISQSAVALARSVGGPDRFVIADVGPVLTESGEFADLAVLDRVIRSLHGADALLLETCSTTRALEAAQYVCQQMRPSAGGPVLLSLAYRRDAAGGLVTLSGHPPETYAQHARRHGVAALGVNCGRDIGMDEIVEIVRRYRRVTDLPLLARPNAGAPTRAGGRWIYPHTPETMAGRLPELLAAGITLVGGCCGTTPEHLAAFRPVVDLTRRPRPGQ